MSTLPKSLYKFILYFLKPIKWYFLVLISLTILISTLPAVDGYITKYFIEYLTYDSINHLSVFKYPILFAVWWGFLNISHNICEYCLMKIIPTTRINIISHLTDYAVNHSHKYFQENFTGSIANKISEMSKSTSKIIEIFTSKILIKSLMLIFSIIAAYTTHKTFAILFSTWNVVFILGNIYLMKYIENYSKIFAKEKSKTFGRNVDLITNIANVRYFANKLFEINYLNKQLNKTRQADVNLRKFEIKTSLIKGLINNIFIGLVIYFISTLYINKQISIGDISLIIIISLNLSDNTWTLVEAISDLTEEVGTCNQALTLISKEHDIKDATNATKLVVTKGEIEFKNVHFKYLQDDWLFEDLSVKINPGSKVGLVGYSGSGKSTFINLIIRLFDINKGQILIDSQNISKITQDSLRQNISFIPQDPLLFHRSLMDNIRYGKLSASDDEVIEAAKLANAHEFIIETEQGYASLVGERGIKLSGGQRQRIAIARAILKNAPILILDEATSSLDSLTEKTIQDSLAYLMKDKTTIVIAHRLSTLLNMDRILVFDKGKIIEDANHEELLAKNGLYANLWNSQINGFITPSVI
ncbi:MAG: ABC transporter ATP-binding protein [Sphingobacteriia bacterium]|nr:ABC transporter ATP-binding protein [Sphingobacteriia bacterium]